MSDTCRNCLAQEVCDITGASCKKMGALFSQHNRTPNGRTTMTNTAKNSAATPKTVTEAAEKNRVDETTVPAQATPEKTVVEEVKETEPTTEETEKLTLVQRLKTMAEKLKDNKKAMVILGGVAVIAGLAIKNNLKAAKAVSAEPLDAEDTTINGVGDDELTTDDSV